MDMTTMYADFTNGGNSITATGCTYPVTSNWVYTHAYVDNGTRALNILKALRAKKLVKLNTIDEFIEAMTLITKEL